MEEKGGRYMRVWIMIYLTIAVFYDWRDFRIPNRFNGAGAVITFLLGLVSGMNIIEIAVGGVIPLIICGLLFYIGCLGGGDVKLPVSYTHLTLPTTPYV